MNINLTNVENVRSQIVQKKGYLPYFADKYTGSSVFTDFDSFPYDRFWRGNANSYKPIVIEREAGWRPREDSCYKQIKTIPKYTKENFCFETACSTVYPCKPEYISKYSDRDAINVMLNNNCIIDYR